MILSYIISYNRKHTRCSTIWHDYSVTWLQFDQSDSFSLVRFNQWRSSIVMWFGHSRYSIYIYTVRSVHFRTLLISHKYSFSFSQLIKDNVKTRQYCNMATNYTWSPHFVISNYGIIDRSATQNSLILIMLIHAIVFVTSNVESYIKLTLYSTSLFNANSWYL